MNKHVDVVRVVKFFVTVLVIVVLLLQVFNNDV